MKTKMILVQFLRQKNVNLTVAGLGYPTRHLPPAPRSGRRGYFANLQRFQGVLRRSSSDLAIKPVEQALWRMKSARPQRP